jgi:hypothetical protein
VTAQNYKLEHCVERIPLARQAKSGSAGPESPRSDGPWLGMKIYACKKLRRIGVVDKGRRGKVQLSLDCKNRIIISSSRTRPFRYFCSE